MATNPTLLTTPIAENGQKNTIPATQAAAGDGLLSQSTGFPPETALPLGAGGKAPTREDFNGAFNLLSNIAFYAQKGWTFQYDATQDYFKGCLVIDPSDGLRYECLNDMVAGTVAPHEDTDNDYWKVFSTGGGVPVGFIMPYAGTGLQEGYLDCDGSAVSRTMYPDLFAAIGTTWGAGDGSTTFNLPNLIEAAILNGTYDKTTFTTAGSATFAAPKSGFYKITVKGAGGGGRGGTSGNPAESGGGGGEGGTTIGYEYIESGESIPVVVGVGGTGGAVSGYGTNGGDSTVTVNSTTYTGGGGKTPTSTNSGGDGGNGTIPGAPGGKGTLVATYGNSGGNGGGNGGAVSLLNSIPSAGTNGGGGAGGGSASPGYAASAGGDGYVWFEYIGVTPKFLIKSFDGPTPSSAGIDLTQYAQDLANKADRSLSNLNATGEARFAHVVIDSYYDSTTGDWWRKYADGWLEQGGFFVVASAAPHTITLLQPFADTSYTALTNTTRNNVISGGTQSGGDFGGTPDDLTTTTIKCCGMFNYRAEQTTSGGLRWVAFGMGASA